MRLARIASLAHKWLALIVGVQIVFWVASGLFFTLIPIERIRSEHLMRESPAKAAVVLRDANVLNGIRNADGQPPVKVTVERRSYGPVALAEFAKGRPGLFNLDTGACISPLTADKAGEIARAHVTLEERPAKAKLVESASAEYRGALPAWRVDFVQHGLSVYVSADTGAVTARRSDLWRLYDTLWALHIMDWRDHENFNHPLIIAVTAITLLSVIAGIVLIPYRIRFGPAKPTRDSAGGTS